STRAITPTHTGPFSAPNRPNTPSRTNPTGATFGTHLTKSPRGLSPRASPQPLTGAAALVDERRHREHEHARQISPNPTVSVIQTLLGTSPATSKPKDGPPEPAQMSAPLEKVAKSIVIPEQVTGENMQTSPVSLSSFGSNELTSAQTATATEATAAPMTTVQGQGQDGAPPTHTHHHQPIAPNPGNEAPSNRAFTFPGPLGPEHAPQRQMSLPGYPNNTPKSPSAKRHKCPYCATDFTRHHNLKSHLLTHSQEKPYECTTCQARFRRLHDLKRHTKLHTGERPHTCPKCGRRFARGDALARHNKGQGGCAGRRSSFGIDEDMADTKGDENMDGVVYHDGEAEDDEDGDGRRRVSEPARKRQNTGNSTQAPSSLSSSVHFSAGQPNVFAHGGMTESPKPISPNQAEQGRLGAPEGSIGPPRSPSMPQPMHQSYPRSTARGSSPMALAPPPGAGPHLPSLPGLSPMISKPGSQGGKGSGPSMLHQQISSQPSSMSSHGQGSVGSIREVVGNQNMDVWAYVRELEGRMARMHEEHENKITAQQEEISSLQAQLAQQH
ncbi:hypothetical protein BU24DRAFT_318179, partial [Aaosphaeria arxii CBS 175.79]